MSDEDKAVEASYREIVGSLMWVANQTRPNIANAIRAAARLLHDPGEVHVKAARKIIKYLSGTTYLNLTFRKDSKLQDVQLEYDLETYVDSAYAHKADDRRLVSGAAVCCGVSLVSWFSRTQKSFTLSTTEAEYVVKADRVKESLHVRGLVVFLMPNLGSPSIGVFEDNKGATDFAETLSAHRTLRTSMQGTIFCVSWCGREIDRFKYPRTEDQREDILTKAIGKESFEKRCQFILGIQ